MFTITYNAAKRGTHVVVNVIGELVNLQSVFESFDISFVARITNNVKILS